MTVDPEAAFIMRRGISEDAVPLADLSAATFPLACPPHTSAEDIQAHIAANLSADALRTDLETDGTVFYVVETGDALIGFAMLIAAATPPIDTDYRRPVELRRIYVAKDWIGHGVGDALMARSLYHARTHGYDVMWLGTNQENSRAVSFYTRHGFQVAGEKTFQVGNAIECDHVMTRPIDDWKPIDADPD